MTPETAYVQQKMQQMLHGSLHEKPGGKEQGERSGEDKQVNSHGKLNKILKPILGVSHKGRSGQDRLSFFSKGGMYEENGNGCREDHQHPA